MEPASYRQVKVALALSTLLLGGAAAAFWQSRQLEGPAEMILARSVAQATEYAQTLDGAALEAQLQLFEERRVQLEQAFFFQRLGILAAIFSMVAAFAGYGAYLLERLRQQLVDVSGPVPEAMALSLAPALATSPRPAR